MHHHIEEVLKELGPVLKDGPRAERILKKYWRDKIAIIWSTEDVHRAANELELALTESEAIKVLQAVHHGHNSQYGLKWEDITGQIQDKVLGRKMTRAEIRKFVAKDVITINQ